MAARNGHFGTAVLRSGWALSAAAGLAVALVAAPAWAQAPAAPSKSAADRHADPAVERARDKVFPALVNIRVVTVSYFSGNETKGESGGSGTIITPDGYIVTNHHVIDEGVQFRVTLADQREVNAKLIGEDPLTDLAVLKIEPPDGKPLAFAGFGNSDALQIGDPVIAMGSPFGLSRTVTMGVVSNTDRVFSSRSGDDLADQEFDFDVSSDIFTRWIQHDALINPGNSGGPLVNLAGEIVGVNTRGGMGMGFANASSLVKAVVDEIIAKGSVTRSTIGAAFKSVRRSGHDQGVLVNSVNADGPAAKAGLKPGDVIVEMNGAPVNARFPEEIPLILRQISAQPVGSTVTLTYLRGGERATAQVVTEKLLREKAERAALRTWGIAASEITERMMISRRLDSREGAMVMAARSGGPAEIAEPPLRSGDVIREIDGKPVKTLDGLVAVYKEVSAKEPLPEFVMIRFDRAGKDTLTLIKPRPDKPQDPPREVPKAWIGVATQPVLRDLATQMKLGEPGGFRVTRVYPGTKAAESELRTGDVIVSINGERMAPRGMQDSGMFQRRVRQLSMTEPAKLVVMRGGERVELAVAMERTRIGPDEALKDTNKDFELSVRELTFFDRDDNRWGEDVTGVMVMDASPAGWAEQAGLGAGDLIQSINGTAVTDIPGYRKVMEQIGKDQPARVTFVVLRGVRTQFKFAEPEWKPRAEADQKAEAQPEAKKE